MKTNFLIFLFYSVLNLILSLSSGKNAFAASEKTRFSTAQDSVFLADPTIFYNDGIYYLYGTGGDSNKGFMVYTSVDLKNWGDPKGVTDGYALVKGDTYGTQGFWAPQILKQKNKFYMAYTADENIAIAVSDSPLGPFKQKTIQALSGNGKQIDPYIFIDTNGKKYLYHVRLAEGNRLFVAELKDDLSDVKPETVKECFSGTETWENTAKTGWPVTEGPTVLKHKNLYYLFYSANDFRNIDYAVGYATSTTPIGPWKKYSKNPIISRSDIGKNGSGHGDFFKDEKGDLQYVFHTHLSESKVSPRLTAIVKAAFTPIKHQEEFMKIFSESFHYLKLKE